MSSFIMKNPRLMVLIIALIVVAGGVAFVLLPRQEDPRLTARAARITTVLPGANANRIELLVTEKLEEELDDIEEIKETNSVSSTNLSLVVVELRDDINAEEADNVWARIRDRMEAAYRKMPSRTQSPEFKKFDITANALLVGLRWNRETPPDYAVLRRSLKRLQDELEAVEGTEKSELFGDPEEEILVTLDASKMTAINLSAAEISEIIAASDSKVSAGLLRGESNDTLLEVDGELDSLSRIGQIPIQRGSTSNFLSLEDIASVEKTIRTPADSTVMLHDQPAIALGVQLRASSRIDHWAAKVAPILQRFEESLPAGIAFEVIFEQTPYVEMRMNSLLSNLLISCVAVSIVILLMMGWRSALIVGFSLPLVSLMVLATMNGLGIPMHQMSITGLIIALGLMIDNAIVVVDEIAQKIDQGLSASDAVAEGTSFLWLPLLGSTITTVLSFSPIILMGGPAGEFVGSIAFVTVISVISSFVIALTIIAPVAGLGLPLREKHNVFNNGFSFRPLTIAYAALVEWVIRRPLIGVVFGVILPLLGFVVALDLPEQFFPPADRNQFQIEIELSASGSLEDTARLATEVRRELLKDQRIEEVAWFLGESAPIFYYNLIPLRRNASQYGQAIVTCKPGVAMRELLLEKQSQLEQKFPAGSVLVRQLEQGPPFDAPVEIRLAGPELEPLRDLGESLRLILTQTSSVHHTRAGLSEVLNKITFEVDEEKARLANLDHRLIATKLNTTLEGITGGSILEKTEELPVRVRVSGQLRADLNRIASLDFLGKGHEELDRELYRGVPLSAISRTQLKPEYTSITRRNGQRMNEVQAFIDAGVLPAIVLSEFRRRLEASGFQLPEGYSISFGGAEAERNDAVDALVGKGFIIATLMIVALVLSLQSFRFAAVLFLVAGLSVGLGLGSLWLAGLPWGFMSIVAIMGMIGVAVNDSIVVLSSIMSMDSSSLGQPKEVAKCVVSNTRHILATTFTTVVGFTPLILFGGEFWTPVAIAISGGVGGATLIALSLVPCLFVLLRRK